MRPHPQPAPASLQRRRGTVGPRQAEAERGGGAGGGRRGRPGRRVAGPGAGRGPARHLLQQRGRADGVWAVRAVRQQLGLADVESGPPGRQRQPAQLAHHR